MRSPHRTGGFRSPAALLALLAGLGGASALPPTARASVAHVVQPGESLWSISAANNFTTRSVAAFNGVSEDATLIAGQTIEIPTADEGAAALASSGTSSSAGGSAASHVIQPGESLWSISAANGVSPDTIAAYNGVSADAMLIAGETIAIPASSSTSTAAPAGGPGYALATISGPTGDFQLDPAAAQSFESMRQASLAGYGIDLYPAAGELSTYRTYDQQAYLYDLFLSGQGAPANPPGTSSHEVGVAVDLADPAMRDVIDQIGPTYGWSGIGSEWWHIEYHGA